MQNRSLWFWCSMSLGRASKQQAIGTQSLLAFWQPFTFLNILITLLCRLRISQVHCILSKPENRQTWRCEQEHKRLPFRGRTRSFHLIFSILDNIRSNLGICYSDTIQDRGFLDFLPGLVFAESRGHWQHAWGWLSPWLSQLEGHLVESTMSHEFHYV